MIALIAAVSNNNAIGKNGKLPWHIPEDLKHFKDLTTDHVVIMGRKTWESLPEAFRPLPRRCNVVLTGQENYPLPPDVRRFASLREALEHFSDTAVFLIGGESIYTEGIAYADTLYITKVDTIIPDADAFFPEIDTTLWHEMRRDQKNGYAFIHYEK